MGVAWQGQPDSLDESPSVHLRRFAFQVSNAIAKVVMAKCETTEDSLNRGLERQNQKGSCRQEASSVHVESPPGGLWWQQ